MEGETDGKVVGCSLVGSDVGVVDGDCDGQALGESDGRDVG
jgi:hypothetical protein